MKSLLTRSAVIIATALILVSQLSLVTVRRAHAVAPWTPSSLGGSLALWLDASDATTMTTSGGFVSEWRDKSGNSRNAVQSVSNSQPTLNGSAISISDHTRFMTGSMASGSLPTSIQVTVVFTATCCGWQSYESFPFTRTTNQFATPFDGYNSTVIVGGPTGAYNGFHGYTDIRNVTTRSVLSTSMSAAKVEQYLNGTLQKSDTGNFSYQDVSSIYYVGTRADRYTHFTGTINEIVVTSQLSSSDRANLESYLGAKWALSGIPSAPTNSVAPGITGTARTGDTLTASTGSWIGSPSSYTYQWQRSLTSGGSLVDIGGATNSTYVVSEFDVGYFIKVSVTATNGIGTASAVLSSETVAVLDIASTNTALPVITGTARTGATLTTSFGSWTSSPTSYTYQWKRASTSGGTYSNISSATSATYVLTDSDIDKFIKVSVTATNGIGASSAVLSLATSAVIDLTDSVVPTATAVVSTATGFTFTISNYSSDYTYVVTTSAGSVGRVAGAVTVTGLTVGEAATITIAVSRSAYKPASKTVAGSASPATTTIAPAVVTIDIQAPVTTVAQGQASVVTIAPTTTTVSVVGVGSVATTTTVVVVAKPVGVPVATTTTTTTTTTIPRLVTPTNSVVAPEIAQVATGESALDVGGVRSKAVVTRENNQLVVTSGGVRAVLSGIDNKGITRALDADGNLRLAGGDVVKINVGGFKPGSDLDVWLFSTPTRLGTATVGADGTVSGSFVVPNKIQSGAHRIAVIAKLPNDKSATFTWGVAVGEIKKSSTLTRVLIAIPIALAVGAGFVLPTQARRRKKKVIA